MMRALPSGALALDAAEDEPRDLPPDQVAGGADGRQGRDAGGAEVEIAEADHCDVVRDGDAPALAFEEGAQRDQIVRAGDAVEVGNLLERPVQQQRRRPRPSRRPDD